eukprot:1192062-Prorocentrum_minimum.AAC.1
MFTVFCSSPTGVLHGPVGVQRCLPLPRRVAAAHAAQEGGVVRGHARSRHVPQGPHARLPLPPRLARPQQVVVGHHVRRHLAG